LKPKLVKKKNCDIFFKIQVATRYLFWRNFSKGSREYSVSSLRYDQVYKSNQNTWIQKAGFRQLYFLSVRQVWWKLHIAGSEDGRNNMKYSP